MERDGAFPIRREREQWLAEARRLLRRKVRGATVSQREIAAANDFSPGYVSHMTSGRVPLVFERLVGVLLAIGEPPDLFFREVFTGQGKRAQADEIREGMDRLESALRQLRERGLLDPSPEPPPAASGSRRKTRSR